MKNFIQTALFLIIAILFQVSCDHLPFTEKKKNESNSYFQFQFGRWLKCQQPGAIDIDTGALAFFCYDDSDKIDSGFIRSETNEIITSAEIVFVPGFKLYCGCNAEKGGGQWYKSPTPNPGNGQKVDRIANSDGSSTMPLSTYKKNDILYCIVTQCDSTKKKFQKLAIK